MPYGVITRIIERHAEVIARYRAMGMIPQRSN